MKKGNEFLGNIDKLDEVMKIFDEVKHGKSGASMESEISGMEYFIGPQPHDASNT